jgi:transcriptional regulator
MEVMPGTLDALILRGLSWGPRHGYAVARWIEQSSGDTLVVLDGALYTALHRMEERELIAADWGVSATGRRVKLYRLTPLGRARLKDEARGWNDYVDAIARVMRSRTQPA